MLTLGISTSFSQYGLVLGENEKVLFNSHNFDTLDNYAIESMLTFGLKTIKRDVNEIKDIIVDNGPGGTSSVRTGVAFANAIGYCLKIDVFSIPSFTLLGYDVYQQFSLPVLLAAKSIKGNWFWGYFDNNSLQSLSYGLPEAILPEMLTGVKELVVGTRYKDIVQGIIPGLALKEFDQSPGNIENLIKNRRAFSAKPMQFPNIVIPITENNLIYG